MPGPSARFFLAQASDLPGEVAASSSGAVDRSLGGRSLGGSGAVGATVVLIGTVGVFLSLRLWRLPEGRLLPFSGGAAAVLGLAGASILIQPLGAAAALWLGGSDPAAERGPRTQGLAMLGALLIQIPIMVLVLRASLRQGVSWPWPRAAMLGLVLAPLILPAVVSTAAIGSWMRELGTGERSDPIAHDTLRMIVDTPGGWSTLLSLLAIGGAPLAEEILYRGLGHDLLRRMGAGAWTCIGAVSALFAVAHLPVVTWPALCGLFVLSLALGWARERSGTLLAPIIGHAVFNGLNLMLAR